MLNKKIKKFTTISMLALSLAVSSASASKNNGISEEAKTYGRIMTTKTFCPESKIENSVAEEEKKNQSKPPIRWFPLKRSQAELIEYKAGFLERLAASSKYMSKDEVVFLNEHIADISKYMTMADDSEQKAEFGIVLDEKYRGNIQKVTKVYMGSSQEIFTKWKDGLHNALVDEVVRKRLSQSELASIKEYITDLSEYMAMADSSKKKAEFRTAILEKYTVGLISDESLMQLDAEIRASELASWEEYLTDLSEYMATTDSSKYMSKDEVAFLNEHIADMSKYMTMADGSEQKAEFGIVLHEKYTVPLISDESLMQLDAEIRAGFWKPVRLVDVTISGCSGYPSNQKPIKFSMAWVRSLSIEELKEIDFTQVDYSEFKNDMMKRMEAPAKGRIDTETAKRRLEKIAKHNVDIERKLAIVHSKQAELRKQPKSIQVN